MMPPAYFRFALGLLSTVTTPALAQPIEGEPGERSRSVIRISVSVAPAFKREAASARSGAAVPTLTATDRSLRYAVETRPVDDGPKAGTLVLIVPD
jgi:hypothetical protein